LSRVKTGKFSIADIYHREKRAAIEVKSVAHGNSALKGVIQASMYKEQAPNAILCMQRPRRSNLEETIELKSKHHGVGVIWIDGIPNICAEDIIESATGGCSKPFELWKRRTYTATRSNIIAHSKSNYINEYLETLDQIILEQPDEIFDFAVEPDESKEGLYNIYR